MLPEQVCEVCRDRLDAVHVGVGTHPACVPGGELPAPIHDRLIAALVRAVGATCITQEGTGE